MLRISDGKPQNTAPGANTHAHGFAWASLSSAVVLIHSRSDPALFTDQLFTEVSPGLIPVGLPPQDACLQTLYCLTAEETHTYRAGEQGAIHQSCFPLSSLTESGFSSCPTRCSTQCTVYLNTPGRTTTACRSTLPPPSTPTTSLTSALSDDSSPW